MKPRRKPTNQPAKRTRQQPPLLPLKFDFEAPLSSPEKPRPKIRIAKKELFWPPETDAEKRIALHRILDARALTQAILFEQQARFTGKRIPAKEKAFQASLRQKLAFLMDWENRLIRQGIKPDYD